MIVYVIKRQHGDYLRAPCFTTRVPRWHWTENVDRAWQVLDKQAAQAVITALNTSHPVSIEPIEVR